MTMDYIPVTTREVLASFAGPLTVWVGDTLPDQQFQLLYEDGGYLDLEPPAAPYGQLVGAMDGTTDPVVFSLHAGQGALFPAAPPAFHVSIELETLEVTLRAADVFTASRAHEGTLIHTHPNDANVQLHVSTLVTCYIARYRGTKKITSGACIIIDALRGIVTFQSNYVWRVPGLYEGQFRIRFGTDPPGYDWLSTQKFLIHCRAATPIT